MAGQAIIGAVGISSFILYRQLAFYGNWGGNNYSGGEHNPKPINYTVDGFDDLDRAFKRHDTAYDNAEKAREAGQIDKETYDRQIYEADKKLIEDMKQVDTSISPTPIAAAEMRMRAEVFFKTKTWFYENGLDYAAEVVKNIPLIPHPVSLIFTAAQRFIRPTGCPIILDLDGDGVETVGTSAGILFDQTGSGVKTGTGWVKPDDGLLVLDRNGNGAIDSGRELFGDSTLKSNGQLATDGFDALRDLDSNLDGKISSADAQFANLRVWRDLNQDGISQSGELFTLGSLNIASINVASTANSQVLANGNQIADLGQYTKTDGSTGLTGEVSGSLGDINLATDTFHRSFIDHLDTTAVATLPDMQGSGAVRDLREAVNKGEWRAVA